MQFHIRRLQFFSACFVGLCLNQHAEMLQYCYSVTAQCYAKLFYVVKLAQCDTVIL